MKPRKASDIKRIAAMLTDHPDIINEENTTKGAESGVYKGPGKKTKRTVEEPVEEAKTKKGAHRPDPGTDYDEYKPDDTEFKDFKDRAQKTKDKPGESGDAKIKPGDGAKLGDGAPTGGPSPAKGDKKYTGGPSAQNSAKGLTKKGKNPVTNKGEPGKTRTNRTEKDGKHYPKGGKATLSNSLDRAINLALNDLEPISENESALPPSQGHFASGGVEANELGEPTWEEMTDEQRVELIRQRARDAAARMNAQ